MLQHADGFYQSYTLHLTGCSVHVTAATHTFHNDLYINLINGSGTDIDLTLIIREYETCLDSFDIQQFVGCLCPNDRRTGQILRGTQRDGKKLLVNLCLADCVCLCLIFCSILTEQFSDSGDICTISTQKCGSLKGADTGLGHKVDRIDHDTAVHTILLFSTDLDIVISVLQDLGYHLAGGGCIRLHIG